MDPNASRRLNSVTGHFLGRNIKPVNVVPVPTSGLGTRKFPRIKQVLILAETTVDTLDNKNLAIPNKYLHNKLKVRAYVVGGAKEELEKKLNGSSGNADQGADCHDVQDEHWINGVPNPIANPMSSYKQYAGPRKSWGINALGNVFKDGSLCVWHENDRKTHTIHENVTLHTGSLVVEIEADDGTTGVGITIGGEPGAFIVEYHLSRFIEGEVDMYTSLHYSEMKIITELLSQSIDISKKNARTPNLCI